MSNRLIMPKQTARVDVFYATLGIYFDAYIDGSIWVSNEDYKIKIKQRIPDLAWGAQDGAYMVKQSELTRYFGLVYRDYPGRKAKITDRGIRFYNAYLSLNNEKEKQLLLESIFNDSFGRNNTAIRDSDSNIDPPKLFLRALYDLGKISINGFAYLLYITNDKEISYNDALVAWNNGIDFEREIPISLSNKYRDVKFTKLLKEFGIVDFIDSEYTLSSYTKSNFIDKISKLSIYNKVPELVLTMTDCDIVEGEENQQEKITYSYAFDTDSTAFNKANNRVPIPTKTKNGITKYTTNSRIAKTALQMADFQCAIDPSHKTFISKLGKQYMEAHHLLPMNAQKDFGINIDRVENIVSLCPICHSAIHLGNDVVRLNRLNKLYSQRCDELKKCGIDISIGDLYSKYYK